MKPLQNFLAALLATCVTTQGALFSSGDLNTAIPDGNPNGLSSTINVSGLADSLVDVNVTLNVSGGFNGDLYGYLSFGNGSVILLNHIGSTSANPFGSSTAGFTVTFDDSATTDIHTISGNAGSVITGTYQPDGRTTDPQWVLDTDPRTTSLAAFNGSNPNGAWTLYLADMSGGGGSGPATLVSWGLEITPVPEPINVALGAFAGTGLLVTAWRSKFWRGKKIKVREIGLMH
jgi:subtilisin-like proprotein convertase family protein